MSRISIIIYISIIFSGCKSLFIPLKESEFSLPKQFPSINSDSISISNWKGFITDHYLISLLDTAIKYNQDIQSAFQRIEIARAGIKEAKSAMLPSGGITTSSSLRKFGLYTMDGAGNITTEIVPGKIVPIHLPDYNIGAYASWEIDLWGKLKARKKQSIANFLQSEQGIKLIKSSILSDIATSYYQLISLDRKRELIDTTLQSQKNALQALIEQKNAGRSNELAIQQFIAQGKEMEILRNDIDLEIVKMENNINFLIGRLPQKISRTNDVKSNGFVALSNFGLPSQLLDNRPDIIMAFLELEKNKCQVQIAKAQFFPSFNITASGGFQAFNPRYLIQSPSSLAYGILGNLTAPLINRGAIKADFSRAKSGQIEAMYQYQKSILNAYVDVLDKLNTINNLESNLKLREERVAALSKAIDASFELFKSSRASYLELLYTRQSELDAQWELISNKVDLQIAQITLYKSLGGFTN
jgi:NodT family efflux transporter outer membrane factor (OMF) lipoprotein